MKASLAANRYAQALLSLVLEENKLEEVYRDMTLLSSTIEENRGLENLLNSPIVKTDKKVSILMQIFGSQISELSKKFIQLISSRRRDALLKEIALAFQSLYKKEKNITVAEVVSVVKLDEAEKNKIAGLINATGTVEIHEKIDPSIIGGFIVRVEDKQIDASIAREFNDLRKTLVLN